MNPTDPNKRLQDLAATGIMDSLPETAYDDIATLAAYICDTPIAYISFVDEKRQWYKARIGLPFTETSLDEAMCLPTLLETELVYVPDARQDERFRDHHFVTRSERAVRFYAGVPLINSEGSALGTLCVIDTKKRELNERQKFALAALGQQVVSQLELRRVLNTSRELALYDALTGLANRLLLRDRLALALSQAALRDGNCAVLFVDLDRFKQVNDTLGHEAGDVVLRIVADRLRCLVSPNDTVARYGGDEFVIVLHNVPDTGHVRAIVINVQNALTLPITYRDQIVEVGACIGSSLYPLHATTADELIRHADTALYSAKKSGISQHRDFAP